jgi:hypothetical protein
VPALQAQGPEFKPDTEKEKRKKETGLSTVALTTQEVDIERTALCS